VPAVGAKVYAGRKSFAQRFACHEPARKAILHPAARDGVGDAALRGKPKNEVADDQGTSQSLG